MNLFSVPVTGRGDGRHRPGHNEAGLKSPARDHGRRAPSRAADAGDRTDELLGRLGEIGAMGADVLAIAHKERYLRGRTRDELDGLLRDGAERVGVTDVTSYDTEVDCLVGPCVSPETWSD